MMNFIIKLLTGGVLDKVIDVYNSYRQGQISMAEFEAKVKIASSDAQAEVDKAWAENAAKITESVQTTVRGSKVIQKAYAIVLFLQLFVLVWYQFGTSAFVLATGVPWPAPMASIEWAYLLIGAMIGAGPFVYKK